MKMTMVPEIVNMDMPVEGVFHNLVIAQIHKEYAGQGQKVMNAMWGAGQMMFNKILVIADEGTSITNYQQLAQYVLRHLNPATDVYFSQGPMDVLDHSCSKLGFGGKMCIDGTAKAEEETDSDQYQLQSTCHDKLIGQDLITRWPEISTINLDLLKQGIPCIIVAVKKDRPGHVKDLNQALSALPVMEGVKMILYVEHTVDAGDLPVALWRFCNNLDPRRDHFLTETASSIEPGKRFAVLGLDGTRKTKELDNFQRDWPNIIVADDATIRAVDEKWKDLGLGAFLPSPSLKFKDQIYGVEAVVS
jgi:4-hydroxy-3-polyprenylbenzoate decarboxylase